VIAQLAFFDLSLYSPGELSFPFVGSKREHFAGWIKHLPKTPGTIYEPFAGSAAFSFRAIAHYNRQLPLVWGEADEGMRAIWDTWGSDEIDSAWSEMSVNQLIERWRCELLVAHLQALKVAATLPPRLLFGGRRTVVVDGEEKVIIWTGADLLLRHFLRVVRDRLKVILRCPKIWGQVQVAAAYAVFKRFAHGSVMRTSGKGLNVSLSVDKCKLQSIMAWRLEYPQPERPQNLTIYKSAAAVQYRQNPIWDNGDICINDAPYYCDKKLYRPISPCYPDHKPHDWATAQLCLDALEDALLAKVGTIITTNYYCPALDDAISELCRVHGRRVQVEDRGALKKLVAGAGNAGSGKRVKGNKKPEPVEWVWVINSSI
jgi:hypothetical protein